MTSAPLIKNIAIDKLFVDGVDDNIFVRDADNPEGRRTSHNSNSKGYQRDPWKRRRWIEQRVPLFSLDLLRPLEVARRSSGMSAIIDGGGRWLMAQLQGTTSISMLPCRIHEGLSRKEEAILFSLFDSENYKLRAVDNFLAQLAGGEPMAVAINAAAKPYRIAPSGAGTLKCVPTLTHCYRAFKPDFERGIELIKATCTAAAYGWSGYRENGKTVGRQVDPRCFAALAMLIEVADDRLDTEALHRVLTKWPMLLLIKKINEDYTPPTSNAFTLATAKHLATIYNRSFANSPDRKVSKSDIDNSSLWEAIQEGKNYSALVREARLHSVEETVYDDDDDEQEAA
jgi:hypothetical protein